VHQAEPGQVLVDAAFVDAAHVTDLVFTALAPRRLAGFEEPVVPCLVVQR